MSKYMLLIYTPTEGGLTPEEAQAEMPRWSEYTQSLIDAGVMVSGDALEGIDTATTVRVRNGETVISDGPFADTKEALGGFYIIDVADLDAAQDWASKMPSAPRGSVEIRPVMVFDGEPATAGDTGGAA